MSHYDDEVEVSWAVLTEWRPDDAMVTFDESSLFEKRVAGNVFEAQSNPNRRIQWAAFFAGVQESILNGFTVEQRTEIVVEDASVGVDDCYWEFKRAIDNDDVVSSLYRLNVPFRVLIEKSHSEGDMKYPQVSFQLFAEESYLDVVPPEPLGVIANREDGEEILAEVNSFVGRASRSVSLLEWARFLDRELTTREEIILQYALPYTPEKSQEAFEEAVEIGLERLTYAEQLSEVGEVELF